MPATTRRRTAMITQPTPAAAPYIAAPKTTRTFVAIYYPYAAASTTMKRCVAKKALSFKGDGGQFVHGNVGGGVVEVEAGQTFYLVRATSLCKELRCKDLFYIVLVGVTGAKKCSCPACKPCRHEIAVAALRDLHVAEKPTQVATPAVTTDENPELRRVIERYGDWHCVEHRSSDNAAWQPYVDEHGAPIKFGDAGFADRYVEAASDTARNTVLMEYRAMLAKQQRSIEARGSLNGQRSFADVLLNR